MVDFGVVVDAEDNTDYRVVSMDAVPAIVCDKDYEIPDETEGKMDQDESQNPCGKGYSGTRGIQRRMERHRSDAQVLEQSS